MEELDESIAQMFLKHIEDLNSVNTNEILEIMIQIKQDGEKI